MRGKGVCLVVGEHVQIKAFGGERSFFVLSPSGRREGRKHRDEKCTAVSFFERKLASFFV